LSLTVQLQVMVKQLAWCGHTLMKTVMNMLAESKCTYENTWMRWVPFSIREGHKPTRLAVTKYNHSHMTEKVVLHNLFFFSSFLVTSLLCAVVTLLDGICALEWNTIFCVNYNLQSSPETLYHYLTDALWYRCWPCSFSFTNQDTCATQSEFIWTVVEQFCSWFKRFFFFRCT
jgi:hypothetical protein